MSARERKRATGPAARLKHRPVETVVVKTFPRADSQPRQPPDLSSVVGFQFFTKDNGVGVAAGCDDCLPALRQAVNRKILAHFGRVLYFGSAELEVEQVSGIPAGITWISE